LRYRRSIHVIALDQAPLAARSPVLHEVLEGVVRVFLGMLLPVRIMVPDAVRLFVVLLLQGREEVVHQAFFGIVTEVPRQNRAYKQDADNGDDPDSLLAGSYGIIWLGFEQSHDEYSLLPPRLDQQQLPEDGGEPASGPGRDLQLPDVDAAVAGGDLQQLAAAVQLAANPRALHGAAHGHRDVERDMAVARVGRKFGGEVLRQPDFHPTIAGVQQPAASHLRSRSRGELDVAVATAQVHLADHAIDGDVAVTGAGADVAGKIMHFDRAVAGVDAHWSAGSIHIDVAVAGVQIESSLRRHLQLDTGTAAVPGDMHPLLVGEVDGQLDLVAVLMFGDAEVSGAIFVALGDHARGNGVSRAARDFDGSVIGIDPKGRFRAHRVGLRPVLGKGR